eukprot:GHVU01183155.1.p1 GENE.GHVU01183155.1~~GHVU01183155.1.p1  ORF type:complete len:125 (-),score=11.08 GHVU01183155.1:145-519(-)
MSWSMNGWMWACMCACVRSWVDVCWCAWLCSDSLRRRRPSPGGEFFSHERFWSDRTNTGPFFIALIAAPFLYKGVKSGYYALRYKSVNRAEIISDRYSWLHERMLEDEVDAALIEKWKRRRRSN